MLSLRRIANKQEDFVVGLASSARTGSTFTAIPADALWQRETLRKKIVSVLSRKWSPTFEIVNQLAIGNFEREIFGDADDFGKELMKLNIEYESSDHKLSHLTESDEAKASALAGYTIATQVRLGQFYSEPGLNLELARTAPLVCALVYPISEIAPVISMKWFLNIRLEHAIDQIRMVSHPNSNQIFSYLYETLFLHQKVAISLSEFVRLAAFTINEKQGMSLINAEIDAMIFADAIFIYLKACIEKTMAILAYSHGIVGIEDEKTHRARMAKLKAALPASSQSTFYGAHVLETLKSSNLETLNNYRSGLLHKMGLSDLQPHRYVDKSGEDLPFLKVFDILHNQHRSNTILLIEVIAMMTDDIMNRKQGVVTSL